MISLDPCPDQFNYGWPKFPNLILNSLSIDPMGHTSGSVYGLAQLINFYTLLYFTIWCWTLPPSSPLSFHTPLISLNSSPPFPLLVVHPHCFSLPQHCYLSNPSHSLCRFASSPTNTTPLPLQVFASQRTPSTIACPPSLQICFLIHHFVHRM